MSALPMPEEDPTRRAALIGIAAGTTSLLLPQKLAAAPLILTPGQTEGPFYPIELPTDRDNDLVRVAGHAAEAAGRITHVSGRVLNLRGNPVPGTVVEIWQCDSHGVYRHPRAPGQASKDTNFQGFGRTAVAADGSYRFRTIRPVAYPGRAPHIHFAVLVPGHGRLVTQMYVEGEPLNARDGVLNGIRDQRARQSVIVRLEPAPRLEAGALTGTFDIVVNA
jgi:protocatechuate 3,4-dioxygenase beta subunit